jgi:hypothetical protein
MARKDRIWWLEQGLLPVRIGFCPSEAAWVAEMKRLGKTDEYPSQWGCCASFVVDNPNYARVILVTFGSNVEGLAPSGLAGLAAHEAAHAWQYACEVMGEDQPGDEVDAHALQFITGGLFQAFEDTRR